MTKTDDILDACWRSPKNTGYFSDVGAAFATLLEELVDCAIKAGVSEKTARDSYIDWILYRMKDGSFLMEWTP